MAKWVVIKTTWHLTHTTQLYERCGTERFWAQGWHRLWGHSILELMVECAGNGEWHGSRGGGVPTALWPGRRLLCQLGEGANTVLMVGGPGEESTLQVLGECPPYMERSWHSSCCTTGSLTGPSNLMLHFEFVVLSRSFSFQLRSWCHLCILQKTGINDQKRSAHLSC